MVWYTVPGYGALRLGGRRPGHSFARTGPALAVGPCGPVCALGVVCPSPVIVREVIEARGPRSPSGRRGGGGRKSPGPTGDNGHGGCKRAKKPGKRFFGRRARSRPSARSGASSRVIGRPPGRRGPVGPRVVGAMPPWGVPVPENGPKTPRVRNGSRKAPNARPGRFCGAWGYPLPRPHGTPPPALRRYPPGTEKGRGPSQPRPLALAPLCLAPPAEPPRGPRRHRLVVPDVCRVLARTGFCTPREKARRDPPRFEVGRVSRQRGPVGLENLG